MTPLDLNGCISSYIFNSANYNSGAGAFTGTFTDASSFGDDIDAHGIPTFTTRDSVEVLDMNNTDYLQGDNKFITDGSYIAVMHVDINSDSCVSKRFDIGHYDINDHLAEYDASLDSNWLSTSTIYRNTYNYLYDKRYAIVNAGGKSALGDAPTKGEFYIIVVTHTSESPAHFAHYMNGDVVSKVESPDLTVYDCYARGMFQRIGIMDATACNGDHASIAELHFFNNDITQDANYATVVADLKTKYGIV